MLIISAYLAPFDFLGAVKIRVILSVKKRNTTVSRSFLHEGFKTDLRFN